MTNPRSPKPVRRLLAVAVAGIVLTTGACSASSDKRADSKSSVGSTSESAAGATTTVGSSGGDSDSNTKTTSPPAEDKGSTEVLATTTGQRPADPNDGTAVALRLDVTSIKRLSGDTVEVTFDLTNTSEDSTYKPYDTMSDPTVIVANYDVGGMALLDRPDDKKYLTLYDTDEICLCSDVSELELEPGKTVSLYADLSAPPNSVDTVDLTMVGFDPITGLKIR